MKQICGGRFLECSDTTPPCWSRTGNAKAKDFLTVIRQAMGLRLTRETGIRTRSFLSQDGKTIFMVLYANFNNLLALAEDKEIHTEIDIGFCDLMSLEPVDSRLRPLRLNTDLKVFSTAEDVQA